MPASARLRPLVGELPVDAAARDDDAARRTAADVLLMQPVRRERQHERSGRRLWRPIRADIEVALLARAGPIAERTTICTSVHELQVLDEDLPEQAHDFRVDVIVTPERIVWCGHPKRPPRLDWGNLSAEQNAAIPVLARWADG